MGIRNLCGYMKIINAIHTINITSEIEKYRTKYNKNPIIIIDNLSIHSFVYTNDKEKLLGGRYDIYNDRANKMFKILINLGCDIILVADGLLIADKITTQLEREKDKYQKNAAIVDAIDNGLSLSDTKLLEELDIPHLRPFFSNYRSIAKKYSRVKRTVREADQEIVWLANQMNALAIISDDSDFMIFDGNWQFWNARDLNLDCLTITRYDKAALKSHLSLTTSDEMILFSTLAGNDFLKYDKVKFFHQKIAPSRGFEKFKEIANIVRNITFTSSPYKLKENDENYLVNMIFSRTNREAGLNDFRNSIKFYCDAKFESEPQFSALETAAAGSIFTYAILVDRPQMFTLPSDLTSDEFLPYYQLVQPLISRSMGIILKHKENKENITRTFYAKLTPSEDIKAIIEKPIFPDCDLPPLLEILTKPFGENEELDNLRIKLLCWTISPNSNLKPETILNLPEEHVSAILIIYVLVEHMQITIEEADCLLFANVADISVKKQIKLNQVNRIEGRAYRITHLFTRFFQIIGQSLNILGLLQYDKLIRFDGVYFHYIHRNWNKAKFSNTLNQLHEQYKQLRIYAN